MFVSILQSAVRFVSVVEHSDIWSTEIWIYGLQLGLSVLQLIQLCEDQILCTAHVCSVSSAWL